MHNKLKMSRQNMLLKINMKSTHIKQSPEYNAMQFIRAARAANERTNFKKSERERKEKNSFS